MTYGELKTKINELLEVIVNTPHEGMMYPDTQPLLDFLDNNEEIKELNSKKIVKLKYLVIPEDYAPESLAIGFVEKEDDFIIKETYSLDYSQVILLVNDFKLEEHATEDCTNDTTLDVMADWYAY